MSDALTDITRDQQRASAVETFLTRLADYLEAPGETTLAEVTAAAQAHDAIPGGFSGRRTRLAPRLDVQLPALLAGDEREWSSLLLHIITSGISTDRAAGGRVKARSPFADRVLIAANYGAAFAQLQGEFERAIAKLIAAAGGRPYNGEQFIVALRPDAFDTAIVIAAKPPRPAVA